MKAAILLLCLTCIAGASFVIEDGGEISAPNESNVTQVPDASVNISWNHSYAPPSNDSSLAAEQNVSQVQNASMGQGDERKAGMLDILSDFFRSLLDALLGKG